MNRFLVTGALGQIGSELVMRLRGIYGEIKKHIPEFEIEYNVDPVKQKIAQSWPNSLDDNDARKEWGWDTKYNLSSMTVDVLEKLRRN